MRHIPEDELHAYLDQALSRTQCVEIESHLADCPSCRATRDGIAALRDRTTALLARLAPPTTSLPPFETLRGRAAEVQSQRRRRLQAAAWAASLILALGLGWSASSLLQSHDERAGTPALARALDTAPPVAASLPVAARSTAAAPTVPVTEAAPLRQSTAAHHAADRPMSQPSHHPARSREVVVPSSQDSARAAREATLSVLSPTPTLELTGLDAAARQDDLAGMWRTMSWDGAKAEAGERLPHIDGLPVVQVQVQSGEQSSRPVTVVAQQLASGQVIRTIEGPATDVSQLLSRRSGTDSSALALSADSARINDGHAMAMQVGDRMLAITGDLPSDSLRAMIRRLNAELRTK
ncbi:MAG: zf-HC2 domain-containing protein [Gemmatimonadales bacterium]